MDAIDVLLSRGVDSIYPTRQELEKVLRSGKKLKLYQGFDPSGANLHIGHAVGLRKLRQFQDLGHEVIFLIGDFTGMIGDPSGKTDARKPLTREQVLDNAKEYKNQAGKIVRFDGPNPVQIKFNSTWNSKLTFEEVLRLSAHFTAQQMLERDMFQERLKNGKEISLVEFLYPVMVAHDAVAMEVDLELGGTDQTFNMLAGRKLHRQLLHKEKFVLTVPLLSDSTGRKIGKTEGNVIGLTDAPAQFYGKIMSLGDDAILPCFQLLTDVAEDQMAAMQKAIHQGANPMQFKKQLAFELTKAFNDEQRAQDAQEQFEKTFQQKDFSSVEPFLISNLPSNPIGIIDLLVATKTASSNSDARRLINQRSVEIDQTLVDLTNTNVTLKPGMILKVGKKKFLKFE